MLFPPLISPSLLLAVPFVESTSCKQPPRQDLANETRCRQLSHLAPTLSEDPHVEDCYLTCKTTNRHTLGLIQHLISTPYPTPIKPETSV